MEGTRVGDRYELQALIGQGGMGRVYRALDHRLDGRPCALKILAPTSEADALRAERERRIISQLHGRHTVQVLDSGALPDGRPFLVMELLEGESVEELLRRGPLPEAQAVSIAMDVLTALVEAHELGVVHRDIKPANVFMARDPAAGTVAKVLDFGVARRVVEDLQVTQGNARIGTPAYMAPEQCRELEADPRADLYAVGALLHCMLSGRPPFSAEDPVPETIRALAPSARLAWLQIHQRPTPPPASPALQAVVARLLQKAPEDRYPAADSVLEALEDLEAAPPPAEPARPRRWPWILLALLLIGAAFSWPPAAKPPAPDAEPGALRVPDAAPPPVEVAAPPPSAVDAARPPPPKTQPRERPKPLRSAPPKPKRQAPARPKPDAAPVLFF